MFEKCGRTTKDADGRRTPDHGYTISSPCEPKGSGELIMWGGGGGAIFEPKTLSMYLKKKKKKKVKRKKKNCDRAGIRTHDLRVEIH